MKKIKCLILAAASLLLFAGCTGVDASESAAEYKFYAVVKSIGDKEINVDVTSEDGVHFGEYRILTTAKTEYYAADGVTISMDSIESGDVIEVKYNGQVMRSFPPQVVAIKIKVADKSK